MLESSEAHSMGTQINERKKTFLSAVTVHLWSYGVNWLLRLKGREGDREDEEDGSAESEHRSEQSNVHFWFHTR